ncbi:MAG: MaoC family dehydratase [Rhizobiales bacterium]|nr:MaoC family dehydratase [Hyphomicrobiales bacterium]
MSKIHLDDLEAGQVYLLGSRSLSEEEIIAFARDYDPQPFHVDPQAAVQSIYGGVIASGWHTASIFMRLFVDGLLSRAAAMGSPGLDELRWLRPVRPGDRLDARVEVLETRASRSRPDRGLAKLRCVVADASENEVLTFIANVLFQRRETG